MSSKLARSRRVWCGRIRSPVEWCASQGRLRGRLWRSLTSHNRQAQPRTVRSHPPRTPIGRKPPVSQLRSQVGRKVSRVKVELMV